MRKKHPVKSRTRRFRVTLAVAHLHTITLPARSRREAERAAVRQWVERGAAGFLDEALAAKGRPIHATATTGRRAKAVR